MLRAANRHRGRLAGWRRFGYGHPQPPGIQRRRSPAHSELPSPRYLMAPIGTLSTGNARCAEKPVRRGRDCEGPYLRLDQNGGYSRGTQRIKLLPVTNGLYDPPLPADTVRECRRLAAAAAHYTRGCEGGPAMGADAAVERHDGAPPGEDEIAARMRAEGLSPHGWGNGPDDTTAGMSTATKRCCIACAAGSCSTPPVATSTRPWRHDGPPAAHCARGNSRRGGRALHRGAPPSRLETG